MKGSFDPVQNLYIYKNELLSVCLSVCMTLIDSETTEPIGVKICMQGFLGPGKVLIMVWDPSPLWEVEPPYKLNTNFYITREPIEQT